MLVRIRHPVHGVLSLLSQRFLVLSHRYSGWLARRCDLWVENNVVTEKVLAAGWATRLPLVAPDYWP